MKRRNRTKTWSELTKKEQQAIYESWNHSTPPEDFIYIIGNLALTDNFDFHGNLYVSVDVYIKNSFIEANINISGHFIVRGHIDAGHVTVGGDFIVGGNVDAIANADVKGNFIVDGDVDVVDVTVGGDFIVLDSIDSWIIEVNGILDCYDVNPNGYKIYATDYVCRCYEEKNK